MRIHLDSKRKIVFIFTPLLVVLAVVGFVFGIKFNVLERSNANLTPQVDNSNYHYSKVYLADKDDVLYPLTVKYQDFDNQGEELMHILSLLKKDSVIANEKFNGLLPKDLTINGLSLKDGNLNINFNDSFKEYDDTNEMRIVESLIWTFLDLDYVDSLTLSLNDELLTKMPNKNMPLSYPLTKEFGINNYLLTTSILGTGTKVFSYYEKQIDNDYYYVPVSHYVNNKKDLSIYDLTIQTMFTDPGITSSLDVCRCLEDATMLSSSVITDNVLYLSLSEDILFDELTVSYDVYKILKEVALTFADIKDVSFLMDLEEVSVNGKVDENESTVSSVELNKFYI